MSETQGARSIVSVEGLVKRFGDFVAVDGVSFQIAEGSIFGLLGPNGAGKTTAISMISCLITPDGGDVIVDGRSVLTDSAGVRRVLGIVPQEIALYPTLTAAENLRFWGKMYGLSGKQLTDAVAYGLRMAGLEDRAKDRVETFSGGMKRRINIAAGILHRPRVLLMDEPTVGIDPQSRNHILETVRELNREGMTVLYTSHYMEEVEALCDSISILDHGKVIATGSLEELRALVGDEDRIRVTVGDGRPSASGSGTAGDGEMGAAEDGEPAAGRSIRAIQAADAPTEAAVADAGAESARMRDTLDQLRALPGISRAELSNGAIELLAADAGVALAGVVGSLTDAGVHVRGIDVVEPDLESVFLHLTGRGLRD